VSKLPRSTMRTLFALALVASAVTWLLTHSEFAQFLVLFVLFYVPGAIATRRANVPDAQVEAVEGLSVPWRLILLSSVLVLPVGIAIFFLSGAVDLGLFWLFALLWPWLEILDALVRRDIKRHGIVNWKPERPLREAVIAVTATTLFMAVFALFDGAGLPEALLIGGLCGLIVLALGLGSSWLHRGSGSVG
jgi:hypothetical protein